MKVVLTYSFCCNSVFLLFPSTRRDTVNDDGVRPQELLHFHSNTLGELVVHKGKCLGERRHRVSAAESITENVTSVLPPTGESQRLGRSVYCGFEANSGEFSIIYEWSLRWSKRMGKFFTSQEKSKIENCKKQASKGAFLCASLLLNAKFSLHLLLLETLIRSMQQKTSSTPSCVSVTQTWCTTWR